MKYLLIGLFLKIMYILEYIEYCNIIKKKFIFYKFVMLFKMVVCIFIFFNFNVEILLLGILFKILIIKKIRIYCKSYSKVNIN